MLKTWVPAVAVLVALAGPVAAWAQAQPQSVAEAVEQLAGATTNSWVYKRVSVTMGADAHCIGEGKIYRFGADKTLTKSECVEGQLTKSTHTWNITSKPPLHMILTIDGKENYDLLFRNMPPERSMILRVDLGSKTSEVRDEEFTLSRD